MIPDLEVARASYDVHGIAVNVESQAQPVVEAMAARLRDFRSDPVSAPDARLVFITSDETDSGLPLNGGRPVYDTPYGSLHYFPRDDAMCGALAGVELRCEASRGLAAFRSASFTGRDLYLATHPLATISLMELLERRGRFSLHAACLAGDDERGVLLAGPSGSGKSTLALALARAGMSFLSDDIVFLVHGSDSPSVRVLGFADTVGISPFATAQFGELSDRLPPGGDGFPKPLGRIEDLFGEAALSSCTPSALVFPEVAPGELSVVAPLDPGEALLRLVPDVLVTEPASTQAHLAAIGALLKEVRCYTLRSGRDLGRAVELVRGLV
jgi:hypothetical protein